MDFLVRRGRHSVMQGGYLLGPARAETQGQGGVHPEMPRPLARDQGYFTPQKVSILTNDLRSTRPSSTLL